MVEALKQNKTDVTACILCSRNCGLSVEIKDNQFLKIKGDPEHPFSQGYICQKAARLQHYQQHADRLTTPLKRQPDGSFQEVSWDVAIQEIADRLVQIRDNFGGTAFASVGGGGQGNHLGAAYGRQLLLAMKSYYAYNSLAQEKKRVISGSMDVCSVVRLVIPQKMLNMPITFFLLEQILFRPMAFPTQETR